METNTDMNNLAATLAKEMKAPVEIGSNTDINRRRVALPPGWTTKDYDDDDRVLAKPRRKIANVALDDAPSFIDYVKAHGSLTSSTIWTTAEYTAGQVSFLAIINDHGDNEDAQGWRDHRATFSPKFSEEWARWFGKNKQAFDQAAFAAFVEDNMQDIASTEGSATGSQMLEMALNFEANQDLRFKSAMRLQNGGVEMQFVQNDDAGTLQKMQMFDRFSIGIPVFWGGDAYRIDARLRYRARDGKVIFWFELIRPDKTLEAAAKTLIDLVRTGVGRPLYFGNPFVLR